MENLTIFKQRTMDSEKGVYCDFRSSTLTDVGMVLCIGQYVPRGFSMHWRFNFKLNGKVISAKNLSKKLKERQYLNE